MMRMLQDAGIDEVHGSACSGTASALKAMSGSCAASLVAPGSS